MESFAKVWVIGFCIILPIALTIWLVATNGGGSDEGSSEKWSEQDGFNPDDEDYSNEADDLDCTDVNGPVEVDPNDDPNNLDRDGDGVACEWG